MKFELKIGKVSKELIKGDRKEVTTVEDVSVGFELAAEELTETVKSIVELIRTELEVEQPVQKSEGTITVKISKFKTIDDKYEVHIIKDTTEYTIYTKYNLLIQAAVQGALRDYEFDLILTDVSGTKIVDDLEPVGVSKEEIIDTLQILNTFKGRIVLEN